MSTSLAWDERYQNGGFEFGEAPNLYLQSQAYRLRQGCARWRLVMARGAMASGWRARAGGHIG
jgi:hypothetical protein